MKYLLLSIFSLLLISCNNSNKNKVESTEDQEDQFQYEADTVTVITPIDDSGEALSDDSIVFFEDEKDPEFATDSTAE